MPEVRSTFQMRIGDRMPWFELPDAWGVVHAGGVIRGGTGVLVVFACNHCPYVVHLADRLGEMAEEMAGRGIRTVAINSNDVEVYPQDGPEPMKGFVEKHGWNFPYLIDGSQEVALAYGAACTPDFFLFDGQERLAYAGQFDGSRPGSARLPDGGDLSRAVGRLLCGEATPGGVPSSGCSIKWKAGSQPEWWNKG